jgi:hypothetical protein
MTTIMSPSSAHLPKYPTPPQPLTTPANGGPDPENDENLSAYGIESDAEVTPEDEAAEDNDDDGTGVNRDIPPPPVDLLYYNYSRRSLRRNTDMPLPTYGLKRARMERSARCIFNVIVATELAENQGYKML